MSAIVFFGPSIRPERARRLTAADHAGPIKRGDLQRARGYDTVVILDGEFGQSLSVSPKEILTLLDAGTTVIGAASMGALRASELHGFGMLGIGWVYERFKRQAVRRDDEVALTYSPVDGRALTVPLVDVEYWLEHLERLRTVAPAEARMLRRAAGSLFFGERTKEALFGLFKQVIGARRLCALLAQTRGTLPDIKARDAEAALRLVDQVRAPLQRRIAEVPHQQSVGGRGGRDDEWPSRQA